MSDFATFIGGVYNVGFGYPKNSDGAGRRAGKVNFNIEADEQSPYFTGDWADSRNEFTGEVGFDFRAIHRAHSLFAGHGTLRRARGDMAALPTRPRDRFSLC